MDAKTRDAIIMGWVAIEVFKESGVLDHVAEYDPKAVEQMRDAQAGLIDALDPQVKLAMLPSYTKVAVRTARHNVGDKPTYGQVRDCAWGPFTTASDRFSRRITTTNGFELFANAENPVIELTVLTPEEWEAIR